MSPSSSLDTSSGISVSPYSSSWRPSATLLIHKEKGLPVATVTSSQAGPCTNAMPKRHDAQEYRFFMDFEGSSRDLSIVKILESVKKRVAKFRLLGCYPSS
jgi:hypothetical protein